MHHCGGFLFSFDRAVNSAAVFVNYSTCEECFSIEATLHELPDSSLFSLSDTSAALGFLTVLNCDGVHTPVSRTEKLVSSSIKHMVDRITDIAPSDKLN